MAYRTDNPLDGRGGEIAAGRAAMPVDPPRAPGMVCAPTWAGLLPALLMITREAETPEARQTGMRELHRMARAADAASILRPALRPMLAPHARRDVEQLIDALGNDPVAAHLEFLLSRQDAARDALARAEAC